MHKLLNYRRCHVYVHAGAWVFLLIPFICMLLPAFQPVQSIALFSMKTTDVKLSIGATGICIQQLQSRNANLTCVSRAFAGYQAQIPPEAISQADILTNKVYGNPILLMGVLLLIGLLVSICVQGGIAAWPGSAFRKAKPCWRAVTARPSTLVLLGFSTWTFILAIIGLIQLGLMRRALMNAPMIGKERSVLHCEKGFALWLAGLATSALIAVSSALLLACWAEGGKHSNGEKRLVLEIGSNNQAVLKVVSADSEGQDSSTGTDASGKDESEDDNDDEDDDDTEGGGTSADKKKPKKKDIPMRQAIDLARRGFAMTPNPPKIAHEFHPAGEDEASVAADGRPLQKYTDAQGQRHKQVIAADVCTSPVEDIDMPTPKQLAPEQHPWAAPVWTGNPCDAMAGQPSKKVRAGAAEPLQNVSPSARPQPISALSSTKKAPSQPWQDLSFDEQPLEGGDAPFDRIFNPELSTLGQNDANDALSGVISTNPSTVPLKNQARAPPLVAIDRPSHKPSDVMNACPPAIATVTSPPPREHQHRHHHHHRDPEIHRHHHRHAPISEDSSSFARQNRDPPPTFASLDADSYQFDSLSRSLAMRTTVDSNAFTTEPLVIPHHRHYA